MKKTLIALILLMLLGAAQPLWGGTVYVYAVNKVIRGNTYETDIRAHNDSGESAELTYLFIPSGTNGVTGFDREVDPIKVTVRPHKTVKFVDWVPAGERGVLEISADESIVVTARLIGTPGDGGKEFGTELPVVTSRSAVLPGRTAILNGLARSDGRVVPDLFLLNLSLNRNTCAIEVFKRGGTLALEQTLNVAPLSLNQFLDVLSLVNLDNASDVSIAVTCDQLIFPFAITQNLETAEQLYTTPAGGGSSTLNPFPSNQCPADALLRLDDTFHIASRGNERATFIIPTTPGEIYSRLTLTMEFTTGPWNRPSSWNHSIFWLQRTSQWAGNLFGYLNAFGPSRNTLKNASNVDLPRGVINAVEQGAVLSEGRTYVVNFTYDAAARFIETVVSVKGGAEIARMEDTSTVNRIRTKENFQLVFGHDAHELGREVATLGWRYSNVCLQLE